MRLQGFGLAPDLSLYFNRIPKQKTKRLLFDLNSFLYFINWHGVSHLLHMEVKLWTPVLWWKDIARARGVPEPVAVSTGGQRGNVWIGRQVRYPPCFSCHPFTVLTVILTVPLYLSPPLQSYLFWPLVKNVSENITKSLLPYQHPFRAICYPVLTSSAQKLKKNTVSDYTPGILL